MPTVFSIRKKISLNLRCELEVLKSSVKNPIMASAPSPPYRFTFENLEAKKLSKFWDLKTKMKGESYRKDTEPLYHSFTYSLVLYFFPVSIHVTSFSSISYYSNFWFVRSTHTELVESNQENNRVSTDKGLLCATPNPTRRLKVLLVTSDVRII